MLAKRIIPCLDVKNGRVVKGVQFVGLRDSGDPAELAARYELEGADELVLLDISASLQNRQTQEAVVLAVARELSIPLTVGGGVRAVEDWQRLLRQGADKVAVNTAAVQQPDLIRAAARQFGSQCVIVAMDVRRGANGWQVYTHGGTVATHLDAVEWARTVERAGAGEILLTSMDADGTRAGYDCQLTKAISETVGIPVIASGGAGSIADFVEVLTQGKADAALAASLFHERVLSIPVLKSRLAREGDMCAPMKLKFDQNGLIPVVVQAADSGTVLMLAYMNEEALARTKETGLACYYSRSRQQLWQKGETSGNIQVVRQISYDCDSDTLLLQVEQRGNACHTGAYSCFYRELWAADTDSAAAEDWSITTLYQQLLQRRSELPPGSYTADLFRAGIDRIAKKVLEEAGEVVIAAKNDQSSELIYEVADLCFHTLVLLAERGISPEQIVAELRQRSGRTPRKATTSVAPS